MSVVTMLLTVFKQTVQWKEKDEAGTADQMLSQWPRDAKLVPKVLRILSATKPRHMPAIAYLFRLREEGNRGTLLRHIEVGGGEEKGEG